MKIPILTFLALVAFAANSVLCRMALASNYIDPASFTLIRLISGSFILVSLSLYVSSPKQASIKDAGDWLSGSALFAYAAGFSFAYIALPTGLGALLLFGSVQITMMSVSLFKGERLTSLQWMGFSAAIIGLIWLLLPAPVQAAVDQSLVSRGALEIDQQGLVSSLLMLLAGIAWGVYSLKGKSASNATLATTGNFLRASVMGIFLYAVYAMFGAQIQLAHYGVWLAICSGAITSGLGYAIWYAVLPSLKGTSAASLQLTVPVIAALGGSLVLAEAISMRLLLSSALILGGVLLVIKSKQHSKKSAD